MEPPEGSRDAPAGVPERVKRLPTKVETVVGTVHKLLALLNEISDVVCRWHFETFDDTYTREWGYRIVIRFRAAGG